MTSINRLPGLALMALSALAFSLMAVCIKFQKELPVAEIVFFRGLICAAITLVAMRLSASKVLVLGNRRGLLLLRGLFGFTGLYLYAKAIHRIDLADAVALQYTHPLFASVFAAVFLGEVMRRMGVVAMLISAVGAVIVLDPQGSSDITGNLLALGSGIASAMAYTCVRSLNRSESPLTIILVFHVFACVFGAIVMVKDFVWPTGELWLWILSTAVVSQAGQWFLTLGLRKEKTGIATTVSYLAVVLSAGWAWLIFDSEVRTHTIIGTAVMILGMAILWRTRTAEPTNASVSGR